MNNYRFYHTFTFILQAFKETIYGVRWGVTGKRAWQFTTPHGTWTLTLSCEEAENPPEIPAADSLGSCPATLIFVDDLGVPNAS